MPAIVSKSISILSDAGLGMAMFSLGTSFFVADFNMYILFFSSFFVADLNTYILLNGI